MARVGPVKRGSVLRRDMGDETVLYDSKTGAVHALNPTASLVWDLCDGEHSLEAMEEILRGQFSVSESETITEDIRKVIDRFTNEGLLEKT